MQKKKKRKKILIVMRVIDTQNIQLFLTKYFKSNDPHNNAIGIIIAILLQNFNIFMELYCNRYIFNNIYSLVNIDTFHLSSRLRSN